MFRADAATRCSASWDSELCAGEMLRSAGYRPAPAFGARGGLAAGRGGSVAALCVWFTTAMRFCWKVLRLVHDCRAFLLECLRSITPVSFPLSGKERRLAISCVSIPRGSGSPLERSRAPCGYRTCLVHFGLERFFAAIPTENDGTRRSESAARRECAFA